MRFSFEGKYSQNNPKYGAKPGPTGYDSKFGIRKNRRCLCCSKEITDDGSLAFLRGFCTDKCMNSYLDNVQTASKNNLEEELI
ncbi:MAG: hypothetical protein V1777_00120 [Candidatus Micrarchaeota archaeon]